MKMDMHSYSANLTGLSVVMLIPATVVSGHKSRNWDFHAGIQGAAGQEQREDEGTYEVPATSLLRGNVSYFISSPFHSTGLRRSR